MPANEINLQKNGNGNRKAEGIVLDKRETGNSRIGFTDPTKAIFVNRLTNEETLLTVRGAVSALTMPLNAQRHSRQFSIQTISVPQPLGQWACSIAEQVRQ